MSPFRLQSRGLMVVVLVVMTMVVLQLIPPARGSPQRERSPYGTERKVKRESDVVRGSGDLDGGDRDESEASEEVVYDQRQVNGETNIRLNIKNFQLRIPESQLVRFQQSDMAQLVRNSVLQLFGLPAVHDTSGDKVDGANFNQPLEDEVDEDVEEDEEKPTSQKQQPGESETAQELPLPEGSASMLQVNGNNLPAKFFLEISDFLMNTFDNDAVDDMRVETNHNQHQQMQRQQEQQMQQQQQQHQQGTLLAETPLYAMEEIKIERVANSNNVKNETITISKKIKQVAPVPRNGTALETVSTENRFTSNATRNATENEDRFVKTKPIRLDTVVMRVETDAQGHPKTLREKVIWKMPDGEGNGRE
ncbi:hypothetical protein ZHAS_00010754 [Anopheles sinensis]|uniref:Uncharacterized protein n=1 Tax=Anopheles sinensis TaxID=74873 RepID=A0A084VYN0_ANOSI|nr:hypothetical protein ZHAS_00010754 [Anopheles sinensis]